MGIKGNVKAVSTIILIILMILSAIIGGIASYMFTISYFTDIPQETTLTITGVYFRAGYAGSFVISVLNPSYSPTNTTITGIALNRKGDEQLYYVTEANPVLSEGINVEKGEEINITCSKVNKEGFIVTWGSVANDLAGMTVIVHVFSSTSPAANMETTIPFVKLRIPTVTFDPDESFEKFNVIVSNDNASAVNLTINEVLALSIQVTNVTPSMPYPLPKGENVTLTCTGNWSDLAKTRTMTTISVSTLEGYSTTHKINLPTVDFSIQNVLFNEDDVTHFNVTVSKTELQNCTINVTKIICVLDNGTTIEREYPSLGMELNSTRTFMIDWNWKEYRGRTINVTAYSLQDYETSTFTATTPPSIIIKVINEADVFNLQDRTHLNITLLNHQSSLGAVNITRIVVMETGELINGTKTDPQMPYGLFYPDQIQAFYCNITDWTSRAGTNFTLVIYAIANTTSQSYTFTFTFKLPAAELNITEIANIEIGGTNYLNITVANMDYSIWNLTISKVTIMLQNQTQPLEQIFPQNQTIIKPSEIAVLLCAFDWEQHQGENVTITIVTNEGTTVSQTYQIP